MSNNADEVLMLAGALAMREKIARAISMNPRKVIYEVAAHIRESINPPTVKEILQFVRDAESLAGQIPVPPIILRQSIPTDEIWICSRDDVQRYIVKPPFEEDA